MDKLPYLEQYKLMREEVLLYIQLRYRTEFSTVIAVGLVYGWLIHEAETIHVQLFLWCVPTLITLVAAHHCYHFTKEMHRIGEFLYELENAASAEDARLLGWEHHKGKRFDKKADFLTICIWMLVLLGSFILSCFLHHHQPHL